MRRLAPVAAALVLLAGCGADPDSAPGGVSREEAARLDAAAAASDINASIVENATDPAR